ncbi:hypothetical protein ACLKA7_004787 [Drosophila subpalustris]
MTAQIAMDSDLESTKLDSCFIADAASDWANHLHSSAELACRKRVQGLLKSGGCIRGESSFGLWPATSSSSRVALRLK